MIVINCLSQKIMMPPLHIVDQSELLLLSLCYFVQVREENLQMNRNKLQISTPCTDPVVEKVRDME